MSNMTSLNTMILSNNDFSGNISSWMSKVPLQVLDLSGNQLTGEIPDEWSNMHDISYMDISNNYITGEVIYNYGFMCMIFHCT